MNRVWVGSILVASISAVGCLCAESLGQSAPTTRQYLDADESAKVSLDVLYNAALNLSADNAAKTNAIGQANAAAAANAQQMSELKTEIATLQAKLAAAPQIADKSIYHVSDVAGLRLAIAAAQAGDSVVLARGTYKTCIDFGGKTGITLAAQTIVPLSVARQADGTLKVSGGNVVVDATGFATAISGGTNITLRGITVDGCSNELQHGAVICGSGWIVENLIVQNVDTAGIWILKGSSSVTWNNVATINNGYLGYGGTGTHVRIDRLFALYNNSGRSDARFKQLFGEHGVQVGGKWFVNPGWESGNKFSSCSDLVMDHSWAEGNGGPGNWLDFANANITIQNSASVNNRAVTHDYDAVGFMSEINPGPVKYINCYSAGNKIGFICAESHGVDYAGCHVMDSATFRNMADATNKTNPVIGLRNGGCFSDSMTGNFFYGNAKLYSDAFAAGYAQAHSIVVVPNTLGITGAVKWTGGAMLP